MGGFLWFVRRPVKGRTSRLSGFAGSLVSGRTCGPSMSRQVGLTQHNLNPGRPRVPGIRLAHLIGTWVPTVALTTVPVLFCQTHLGATYTKFVE